MGNLFSCIASYINNISIVGVYVNDPRTYLFSSFKNILNCDNVTTIICSKNKLTSLPKNMSMQFPNLQIFNCSHNNLTSLPENMNFPNLQKLDCSDNKLTSLPDNMNLPNLQVFYCIDSNLISLPENMNFPNLQKLDCSDNKLTSLPDNMNLPNLQVFYCIDNNLISLPDNMGMMFPNLREFYCNNNQLTSLPEIINFSNLQKFYCSYNNLTSLPENMILPSLREFTCNNNQLTSLPEQMNFPNLQSFYCSNNQLTSLPICIMGWRNLLYLEYSGNQIELSLQLARFINQIGSGSVTKINVYSDTQNVHNSNIQCSVRDSINRLTTRLDLPKFDAKILNALILTDSIITPSVKAQLVEYCRDDTPHSLLLLTFAEVLWHILTTIATDFKDSPETQTEIKRVLNQEMQDAERKCFTGRMNRVVNCLNGFSPLVDIRISDSEQIGNVIVMLKAKALDAKGNYSGSRHKQLVKHELQERGYDSETVSTWLEYIE